jgi:hypothetical protein
VDDDAAMKTITDSMSTKQKLFDGPGESATAQEGFTAHTKTTTNQITASKLHNNITDFDDGRTKKWLHDEEMHDLTGKEGQQSR